MSAPTGLRALAARGVVHFVGVSGAGMAPLAEMVLRAGGEVSGCDLEAGRAADRLESLGMRFNQGHDPAHVEAAVAVVATSAVPSGHPELAAARARGIPVIKRARALGEWVGAGRVVAVAGTHGKTTTTAMATHVLEHAGIDPTGVVGGEVVGWGGNLRPGGADVFVVEADEYDRSFHELSPEVAVVTNLEADHLDVYGDLGGVRDAFSEFVGRLDGKGTLWVCGDDPGAARLGVEAGRRTRSYGTGAGAELRAARINVHTRGTTFAIHEDGARAIEVSVRGPGRHNVMNALAAAGVGRSFGASWQEIRAGLAAYRGICRRYEFLGCAAGVKVIDDYAHHPTEIAATLAAARVANPRRRLIAVFQPHLFTRTRDFHREFGDALGTADAVWVTDVYPARETPLPGVTGELVARAVTGAPGRVTYHAELATLADAVAEALSPGDVCLVMGAGSIECAGREILARLRARDGSGEEAA
ncbi:MAG: UDP-N-acetylmuramate--L-alanine ligase [Gemmatimonadetes bacterium]|nr:UDP-N-acetylmuramate--L-alanine ligase [Gemmatimonadota bacterium]MYH52530.1 UDP-N-acetylmuramate--L-alanine ligase [Gemmatimonadota bacterium]MYK66063.1 UDP-N-acetylmuramate--L-alanine ligase [Gemmatimonadota bacterium]